MDGGYQPTNQILEGGHVVIDSTPKFQGGGPNGQACNDEHPLNCGGRACEDPRGGRWRQLKGDSGWSVQEHGYQVHVGCKGGEPGCEGGVIGQNGLIKGQHEFEVCPLGDLQDSEGFPVDVLAGACDRVGFMVL